MSISAQALKALRAVFSKGADDHQQRREVLQPSMRHLDLAFWL